MAESKYSTYVFKGLKPVGQSMGVAIPAMEAGGMPNSFIWDRFSHGFEGSKIWVECDIVTRPGFFHGKNAPIVSTVEGETGFGFSNKVGEVVGYEGCHKHNSDEAFFIFGTNPADITSLGGEYEFWLGEGEEAERFTFTENTCVYCPAGLTHNPNGATRVDDPNHPMVFIAVLLSPDHSAESTIYPTDAEGNRVYPPAFVEERGLFE